ncbi:hypothetical protein C8034_v003838 [Colletotrichum sidae]|uniref:Uncharacterized protein n=1 Tax=Colletotrichum sidae TaxID=1347389 RepID=A0A4R8T8U1_9PEZI|nr:hypothetical protein C8034_v003838 [Colletotrichum sidae]
MAWLEAADAMALVGRSINNEPQPQAGKVVSVVVAFFSGCTIAALFAMRVSTVKDWRILPYTMWLVLFIYFFSFLFVFGTSILQFGFGTDLNFETCSASTLFCLGAYVSTKLVRGFDYANSLRMLIGRVFVLIVILNFIFRITDYNNGLCVIGLGQKVIFALISFDAAVN